MADGDSGPLWANGCLPPKYNKKKGDVCCHCCLGFWQLVPWPKLIDEFEVFYSRPFWPFTTVLPLYIFSFVFSLQIYCTHIHPWGSEPCLAKSVGYYQCLYLLIAIYHCMWNVIFNIVCITTPAWLLTVYYIWQFYNKIFIEVFLGMCIGLTIFTSIKVPRAIFLFVL